jgi:hypothetical protein
MIFDKIKFFHNADIRQNIFDYKNLHKIGNKGILINSVEEINLKYFTDSNSYNNVSNITGGSNTYEIKLDDGLKYEFYMDEIIPETNNLRRMCFMSNSITYDCLCVMFGTKKSNDVIMRIESLLGSEECVKCEDNTKKING